VYAFVYLWRRKDNVDQLGKIVSVLGTPDLKTYVSRINATILPDVRKVLTKCEAQERGRVGKNMRVPWMSFRSAGTPVPSPESLDLLDKLLVYDHDARLTAKEAMQHPFFDVVRDRVTNEIKGLAAAHSTR